MTLSVRLEGRRKQAKESFQTAAECVGAVEAGMSLFAITRGQFSMIDAILAVAAQCGEKPRITVWTWTIASYETGMFVQLVQDGRIAKGSLLVIDHGARDKNLDLIRMWRDAHGQESVRYVVNHAKIATVEGGGFRVLLRGSMNLNANPKFEQLDITEGGPDFDLVRKLENELPVLHDHASGHEVVSASRICGAWEPGKLALFAGVKRWAK